ncbi:MAG: HU family DNA-binding protein [Nitrospinota bacterium]|nr:MAG: HU family DNA-binding protein [Nitrospinota bacterium]
MNKGDLIDRMAKEAGITKKAAGKALDSFTNTVMEALSKGDSVRLVGFGSFSVTERKRRKGRNPQTGAEMIIPATKAPKFSAGKMFREMVKNKRGKRGGRKR